MRRNMHGLAGALAVGLGGLSGWATAGAGGSMDRAPGAAVIMVASLGGSGLAVGTIAAFRKRATWWAVLVLLGFYTGTWLNSAYHSAVGDALVLILAAVPTCIGTVLGLAAGRYVAARRSDAHLNPKENRGCGDPQTGP
ncbi:hypothetical protein [Micromonospora auratinigra]|uniref:hypothetical protein n=1 Tax=Micromonospora auratinigra TaxID=261654 RepID=UPI0012FD3BD0|nr:hypothetical protein [Micromonospora auratinigra]